MIWLVIVGVSSLVLYNLLFSGPPYLPTITRDIEQVFDKLKISKGDFLVDLGSGDGRALLAASVRGAGVSGVEINPILVLVSRYRLRNRKLANVRWGSMWRYEIPKETTHIFIFGAGSFMKRFAKRIDDFAHANGKVLVISYGFGFEGRKAVQEVGPFHVYQF
jgi:hypothetical protein